MHDRYAYVYACILVCVCDRAQCKKGMWTHKISLFKNCLHLQLYSTTVVWFWLNKSSEVIFFVFQLLLTHQSLLLLKRHDVISAHTPHFSDPVTVTACWNMCHSPVMETSCCPSKGWLLFINLIWVGVPLVRLSRGSSLDKNAPRQLYRNNWGGAWYYSVRLSRESRAPLWTLSCMNASAIKHAI